MHNFVLVKCFKGIGNSVFLYCIRYKAKQKFDHLKWTEFNSEIDLNSILLFKVILEINLWYLNYNYVENWC